MRTSLLDTENSVPVLWHTPLKPGPMVQAGTQVTKTMIVVVDSGKLCCLLNKRFLVALVSKELEGKGLLLQVVHAFSIFL